MPKDNRRYLGDGVYAEYDGWYIWLTTDYGEGPTNRIALDPEVQRQYESFKQSIHTSDGSDHNGNPHS